MCQGGGLGALPKKFFVLNGVKSCNSRPGKYENALSWKQGMGSWILFIQCNLNKGKYRESITVPYWISMHICNTFV